MDTLRRGDALERFRDHPRVSLRGAVANTRAAYDAHRVFIAPTRYAAGMPYKVHEAASFGLPVVASELLRRQLGWENGGELLSAEVTEPKAFARHIVALYRDEALWEGVRAAAAERVRAENDPAHYRKLVAETLSKLSGFGSVLAPPSRFERALDLGSRINSPSERGVR